MLIRRAQSVRARQRGRGVEEGEHILNLVALRVEVCVALNLDRMADAGRDARGNTIFDQIVAEPIAVIAPICQKGPGLRDGGQQHPCPDIVRGLARREKYADRRALRIGHGMQPKVQSTFRAPDQTSPICG